MFDRDEIFGINDNPKLNFSFRIIIIIIIRIIISNNNYNILAVNFVANFAI